MAEEKDPNSQPIYCPYTGRSVEVVSAGGGLYRQAGAWSPVRTYPTVADARIAMLRRGREWLPDDTELRCPYTGALVTFEDVPGGVRPAGVFDPDRISTNPTELRYNLRRRDGKVPDGASIDKTFGQPTGVQVAYEEDQEPFEARQDREARERGARATKTSAENAAEKVVAKKLPRKIQVVTS